MHVFSWLATTLFVLPQLCVALALPLTNASYSFSRSQVWVQTFAKPGGGQLNLLDLVNQRTRVTHIYLAAVHLNTPAGNIHLNDAPPEDPRFDYVWPQVRTLQQRGVKVLMLLGGAAQGSYQRLAGTDAEFEMYYKPLLALIKKYKIDGLDLDIEEVVDISVPLRLLRRLDKDLGKDFILTMAPVATEMLPAGMAVGLSGIDYHALDAQAVSARRPNGKLVNWYNCQFYNGWGDASSDLFYNTITILGAWQPSRIVMGVLDHPSNGGSGFVPLTTLVDVIHQLRSNYPTFGGIIGWEYFNAGGTDGLDQPWKWVKAISSALYDPFTPCRVDLLTSKVLDSVSPFTSALQTLTGEGASHFEAVKALNITGGDLGRAETLLFPPS